MKIQEIEFNSLNEFITYTNRHKYDKIRLYRGQKKDWPLDSKLLRLVRDNNQIKNIYKIENQIFNNFKDRYQNYFSNSKTLMDWDILSIGQHFGLPTRLIDWSLNPLIALWFAFESPKKKDNNDDRIVWGLVVESDALVNFQKDRVLDGRFVKIFQPTCIDDRIKNQESWFSIQAFEIFGKGGDGLPAFDNYNTLNENEYFEYYLAKFKFKECLRMEILSELDKLGVNSLKIFPDLTGLCKMIEWNNIERRFFKDAKE